MSLKFDKLYTEVKYSLQEITDDELLNEAEKYELNVAKVDVEFAKDYAQGQFDKHNMKLENHLPDFEQNYLSIQRKLQNAHDIPRKLMPVIEPADLDEFKKRLNEGHIDIFKPWAYDSPYFPDDIRKEGRAENFLTLGLDDGNKKDDVVEAQRKNIPVNRLKPLQGQLWLEHLIGPMLKYGIPDENSPILDKPVIVSDDYRILDGHHRWGQACLADPSLEFDVLFVPLDTKKLLQIGRTYGDAIGNERKN